MADVYVLSPSVPVVWVLSQRSSLMLTMNCRIAVLQRLRMRPGRWWLLFPGTCLQMWKRMRTLMILMTVQVGVSRWCYSSQQDLVPPSLPPPGSIRSHRSVIFHILSQLRLGMDITRISLPSFMLERRSFLEMLGESLAHADIFAR